MPALTWASLRSRKGSVLGGVVALFFAAAVVCACGVLLETGLRGAVAPGRFAAAPVVVSGDQQIHWTDVQHDGDETKIKTKSKDLSERVWLPASIGSRLRALPGATVVVDRTFTAELVSAEPVSADRGFVGGRPSFGHNWASARLTPYTIISGGAPRTDDQVVVDAETAARAGVSVGDRIGIQSTDSPAMFTVSGVAQARSPVPLESAVFFSEPEARRLAGHGDGAAAYGVFGVTPAAVRAALAGTGAVVATGDGRGGAALPGIGAARTRLISMSGAVGGTVLIVAILVTVGSFTLSVQQRHRELALLRAIGATPRQIRRMITCEGAVLGLCAAVPGVLVGLPLATLIHRRLVSNGAAPAAIGLASSPVPLVAGVAVTALSAVVAARIAARRVSRIRPAQALTESSVEQQNLGRARAVLGGATLCGAVALSLLLTRLHTDPAAVPVSYLCVLCWITGAALLGPMLVRAGVSLTAIVWRSSPVGGVLAASNSRMYSRRTAAVVTPLALLVATSATVLFVPTTVEAAAQRQTRDGISADWVVESDGPGVPDQVISELRATGGVSAAVGAVHSVIWTGHDKQTVQGLSSQGLTDVINPDVQTGTLARLASGDIALSSPAAQGHRVGDTISTTLGDGTRVALRLVAVYRRGLGFGDALMNIDQLRQHVDTPLAQQVFVTSDAGPDELHRELDAYPGLRLVTRAGFEESAGSATDADETVNVIFLALIVGFCAIAVVNTLAMATAQRARELALFRLVGATKRQLRGVLRWELVLICTLALAIAATAAAATLTGFSIGTTDTATPTVQPWTVGGIVLGAALLSAAALALPARRALARPPMTELTGRHQA